MNVWKGMPYINLTRYDTKHMENGRQYNTSKPYGVRDYAEDKKENESRYRLALKYSFSQQACPQLSFSVQRAQFTHNCIRHRRSTLKCDFAIDSWFLFSEPLIHSIVRFAGGIVLELWKISPVILRETENNLFVSILIDIQL